MANQLCLVFMQADRFIFFGDLPARQLKIVANDLTSAAVMNFDVMLAPHHGTFWDDQLLRLRSKRTLLSNGSRLQSLLRVFGPRIDRPP